MAGPADLLLPLAACEGQPPSHVGRKAARLGWAEANGMVTPGGVVVPGSWFWGALKACGALAQARYLERSALWLDPRHTLDLAQSIASAMTSPPVTARARACAETAFADAGSTPVVCRSSSAMEDGDAAAFPGVFTSVLGIASVGALADAIAACWRSAFTPEAMRYLLRLRAEPVDFSLAVIVQRQVESEWYGVYTSIDPVTGAAQPVAHLTDGPEALTGSGSAAVQARRGTPSWTEALEAVHQTAQRFSSHFHTEVDLEFALAAGGGPPVVLQCRPLTRVPEHCGEVTATVAHLQGRPCAGGLAAGVGGEGVLVVEHLTTVDYGLVFGAAAVVTERDASPLSHIALLCRELGVPLVCGVEGARDRLAGQSIMVDGRTGAIELLPAAVAAPRRDGPVPEPAITDVELALRVLAEGRPGRPATGEAERLKRRYARALGSTSVRVLRQPIAEKELRELQAFGEAAISLLDGS